MTNLLWLPIQRLPRAAATATDCYACAVIDAVDQLDASVVSVLRLEAVKRLASWHLPGTSVRHTSQFSRPERGNAHGEFHRP